MRWRWLSLIPCLALASAAWALSLSGYCRTGTWIQADEGYGLSYAIASDLQLSGPLMKNLDFRAGLRYTLDDEPWETSNRMREITKRYLLLEHERISARIGTYNATLGRGLILSCLDEPRLKVDRDIEGVLVDGNFRDLIEGRALAGRIRENFVEIDTTRTYAGFQINLTPWRSLILGGAYLRANAAGRTADPSFGKPVEELFGGGVAASAGPVQAYAEYSVRHTYGISLPLQGWIGIDDVKGEAAYGSLSFSLPGIGVTAEGKRYSHFDAKINAPPPCNREGRLLNSASDELGFSIDGTASPANWLSVHGNYSWARDSADRQRWEDSFAEARAEVTGSVVVTAEARARQEQSLQPDIAQKQYRGGAVGCQWRYRPSATMTARAGMDQYRNRYNTGPLNYAEWQGTLEWSPLPWAGLTVSGEVADRRVVEYDDQRSWGTASLLMEPIKQHQLVLTYGSTKGGLVCSNGYCRYEPAFKGWKASWEWKF